ncbi:MAG: 3-isopropylmalate dehydratase small subunit [Deltaproteobacteria bacterium]|nr:3-isopropylmalate dehydratase small subunit [Deltaproteobacteria bacterium]
MESGEGKVFRFGDDVDTDLIIAARYLNTSDPAALASHVMEDADPGFAKAVSAGDVIVAGKNFGCGSSREHAPIAIKAAGVRCVVAKSFARIFFRNAFNMGLPILECPEADQIPAGARVRVDFDAGTVTDLSSQKTWQANPIPPFMQELVAAGGLLPRVREKLASGS